MDNWENLKSECLNCRRCSLCETRHNVVFGVGPENAEVLFIGEGPGEQEDLKGEPSSVGAANCLTTCWSSSTLTARRYTSPTW